MPRVVSENPHTCNDKVQVLYVQYETFLSEFFIVKLSHLSERLTWMADAWLRKIKQLSLQPFDSFCLLNDWAPYNILLGVSAHVLVYNILFCILHHPVPVPTCRTSKQNKVLTDSQQWEGELGRWRLRTSNPEVECYWVQPLWGGKVSYVSTHKLMSPSPSVCIPCVSVSAFWLRNW